VQAIALNCPEIRRANKAQAAEFFDVTLPTIDAWIRKGAPVLQRGSRGVSWVLDLRAMAEWAYAGKSEHADADPDALAPAERKAWYEGETKKRELQVRDRELIPAAEVEQVVATAFAAIAQDIRAIPDNLERRLGIDSAVAEAVEGVLFETMDAIADRLASLAPVSTEEVAE
jgi:phage terminase Nu1 subunit (DNA packaging protein)